MKDKNILLELERVKKMVDEIEREQLKTKAVEDFRRAERNKWLGRVKLFLMAIPAVISVVALIRTF